jgi:hypothetical protein
VQAPPSEDESEAALHEGGRSRNVTHINGAGAAVNGASLPVDRSNSLGALAAQITAEHDAVGTATGQALKHALAAGEALLEARERLGGRFVSWIKTACNMPPSTAYLYIEVAEGRTVIEQALSNGVGNLTLRGAVRLLKTKTKKADPKPRKPSSKSSKSATGLCSLDWVGANRATRSQFVDSVGAKSLCDAICELGGDRLLNYALALYRKMNGAQKDAFVKSLLAAEPAPEEGALDVAA